MSHSAPLSASRLSKRYGAKQVLDGIDFQLGEGQVLGLIGRNGAGKSTLIRCLLGLIEHDGGECQVFGEPSHRLGDGAKARLAYVPQQPNALGWLRASEMLDFVGRFYPRWDAALAARLMQRWEIDPAQRMDQLSPGERQRLALIRALAARPDLLVLDEPAAALDPVARRDLLREIALLASDSGATVLFSTHILSDLERVASHVAFVDRGRLLVEGELDGMKERYASVQLPPSLAALLPDRLPGELRRRGQPAEGLRLLLSLDQRDAWPAPLREGALQFDRLGLEDLFVEVVE
ncbi:ABC transporter ATP-binding protein [Pseudomarimonas salicorniae]|uniref:ABC transporter ATP-binding protein n=1 Tax=Pseudomarimonas salicorniae TaxID=2933270 RepID=A0ABT0GL14_9GAMM|nr:ABC transporter ATP-binding protein [Lysobacter sp. CAU 1642]MCK7594914.1 ABC transporter ATP-binding protein [Lysobacter sp. CAU 1642]